VNRSVLSDVSLLIADILIFFICVGGVYHIVLKADLPFKTSTLNSKLMKYFIQREGEVIERNKLLDEVWGYENYPSTRTVDNFILNLRKKIEDDHSNPKHLLTVHGAGYKFVK
jgi:DNA-binding response OmpR family regulator